MKILDWIVCDDIRFENNGKKILIGVYDQSINFRGLPEPRPKMVGLNLFSFIRIIKVSNEKTPDVAKVIFSIDNEIVHEINMNVQPSHGEWKELLTLAIKTEFQFKSSCTLSLKIELIRDNNIIKKLKAPLDISVLIHEKED